jgi:prolipoprotein diacylglyceryltransferase
LATGFFIMVLVYAGQRFLWEFLKPYPPLIGPFNLFHFLCLGLMIYSAVMIARARTA